MERSELAKELQKSGEAIRICWPQLGGYASQMDQAAAALEEEDKNAKRYQRLRHCAVKMWLESQRKVFYLKLLAPFYPPPRYGQVELDPEEADAQFDKTLDAWIEKHADDEK